VNDQHVGTTQAQLQHRLHRLTQDLRDRASLVQASQQFPWRRHLPAGQDQAAAGRSVG
jgi:hypothetical protein